MMKIYKLKMIIILIDYDMYNWYN